MQKTESVQKIPEFSDLSYKYIQKWVKNSEKKENYQNIQN